MGDITKIGWCDHTFNGWWGCSHKSPGCVNCYAHAWANRWGWDVFHLHGQRRILSDKTWARPLLWNQHAQETGVPEKVFASSMADVFEDHPQLKEPRARLFGLIDATPYLIWQLLTKRPENVAGMVPWGDTWPGNVWIGTSIENRDYAAERIPLIRALDRAAVRFLSCEPLLGPVDLAVPGLAFYDRAGEEDGNELGEIVRAEPGVDWVIVGGESGAKRREMDLPWLTSIVRQCQDAEVAVFVKQDSALQNEQQGRIPDDVWALKQFPAGVAS